LLRSN